MMQIGQYNSQELPSAAAAAQPTPATNSADPATTSSGEPGGGWQDPNSAAGLRNEFLTLMVAQIQNQDPLNPMDGAEYVTQLAQFSQVESLEHLRMGQQNMAILAENLQVLGTTNMLGRTVMAPADSITIGEDAVSGQIELDHAVETLLLEVTDEAGDVVATIDLGQQSAGAIDWELDPEELGLPPGEYELNAKSTAEGESTDATVLVAATVERVHIASTTGYMMLELDNGIGAVSLFDIREMA
ncbi:flagellar hook capping FlgD N-terminal domain-containing protein [Ferrimonas marina]|uniref:Basal-body rod modification protein FlgD n=1 Tax=Ferrimonas marina TaxID=299255 RepID=A0A1M5R0W2_9GAMM|nr:flagellar hook capping FlgD N-terminal domain-containing protein [Ferrimonas marina]SHH19609.1 flagellar basal-body rod modification protein FlgD [Ferrimonas marina]